MHKTRLQMLAALGDVRLAEGDGSADTGGSVAEGDQAATDGQDEAQAAAQAAQDDPADGEDAEGNGSKADDPKLRKARDEAYQNRVKARDAEKAAATAREELEQLRGSLAKLFGNDSGDSSEEEAPDVESLTKRATEAQQEAAQAQRQLAVYKAAGKAGGDPSRLLNTVSFIRALDDLDPTDEDAIASAVTDAVKADPTLAQRRERGASTADTASGPGGGRAPKPEVSLQDALAGHYGIK